MAESRKKTHKWLLGDCSPDIVGEEAGGGDLILSHYKMQLPTLEQVLRHLIHIKSDSKYKNKANPFVAMIVASEVLKLWDMAKIPTMGAQWVENRVVPKLDRYNSLVKDKFKQHPKAVKNREDFTISLAED